MRDLGFDGVVTLSLTDPGDGRRGCASPTTTRARAPIRGLEPALGRALGAAHDPARLAARRRPLQPRPRRRARGPVRVGPRLPRRGRAPAATGVARRASSPATARARVRAAPDRGASPSGRSRRRRLARRAPRRRLLRLKGVLEALAAQLGAEVERRAGAPSRSCIPGRAATRAASAARDAGWIGELHPLVCRDVGPRGGGRVRGRPGAARRGVADGDERYEDVITYPGRARGHRRRSSPTTSSAARVRAAVLRRRRRAAALRRGLRRLPRRAGRRGPQEPRAAARVPRPPTARSPTRRSPSAARAITAALAEIGGSLRE